MLSGLDIHKYTSCMYVCSVQPTYLVDAFDFLLFQEFLGFSFLSLSDEAQVSASDGVEGVWEWPGWVT